MESPNLLVRQPYDEFDNVFLRHFTEGQLESYSNEPNEWETKEYLREMERPASSGIASGSGSWSSTATPTFAPMDHTRLSPSAFDPTKFTSTFVPPRFITGSGSVTGPAVVESIANLQTTGAINKYFDASKQQSTLPYPTPLRPSPFAPIAPHPDPVDSPIYDLYGSSVVSVLPSAPSPFSFKNISPLIPVDDSAPYNPVALGLPLPPNKALGDTNWKGLYSGSGFDLLGVLARVAARPNPVINIGPVDTGCSFLVCDARKYDQPIVYASETFEKMCGYTNSEIIGQNCRFLQSPHETIAEGAPRRFTDGAAAWHIKSHIISAKESQTSLINYKKDGTPFINLVTVIPITWDTDEIAYFIGFQIDLVEQPAAILARMKNGTFCVNYSLLEGARNTQEDHDEENYQMDTEEVFEELSIVGTKSIAPVDVVVDVEVAKGIIDSVVGTGMPSLESAGKKTFNQLMFDQSNDFVHVISLKGTLLYVSPSSRRILEYEPSELTGQALSAFCHASDIVNVLRDLKDLASGTNPVVTLLYRIRRKHSGYIWLESSGKLLIQPGKGRKCVILIGRPREVYQMPRSSLVSGAGFGDKEYWSKLSIDGRHLYSTPHVQNVLGFTPEEMLGTPIETSGTKGNVAVAIRALFDSQSIEPVNVRHFMQSKNGPVDVVTHLYPSKLNDNPYSTTSNSIQFSILAQTNLYSSEIRKRGINDSPPTIVSPSVDSPVESPMLSEATVASTSTSLATSTVGSTPTELPTAYLSTYKSLDFVRPENLFAEMEVTNGTSIHFELQQLRLTNKKLREEKEFLTNHQQKARMERMKAVS